jgi:hypothetical protein
MSRAYRQQLRKAGSICAVIAALACAGVAAPALAPWALADTTINARGWSHDDFGRLVLDAAAPLVKSAAIQNRKLVVEFNAPVTLKLGEALSKIGTYVQLTGAAKGTRLELPLLRPVTLHHFIDGDKYVLDLKRVENWPAQDTPPTKAEADPPPGQKQAAAPKPVNGKIIARQGDHKDYVRLAFDWPKRTDYKIERRDGMVVLSFERAGAIDLSAIQKDVPKELLQIATRDDGIARIYLTLAEGATLRDFRLGSTVVLDVFKPAKIATAAKPITLPPPGTVAAPAAQTNPAPAPQAQPTPAPQVPAVAATEAPAEPAAPILPVAPLPAAPEAEPPAAAPTAPPPAIPELAPAAEPPAAVSNEPATPASPAVSAESVGPVAPAEQLSLQSLPDLPQPTPGSAATTPPTQPEAPAAQPEVPAAQPEVSATLPEMPKVEEARQPPRPPVDVQVLVAPAGEGAKITFTWPEPVAAAAFRHNGAVYIAFDLPVNSLATIFEDARIARLGQAAKLDIPDSTVIWLGESKPLGVNLTATGRSWIVDIAPNAKSEPRAAIEQRRETLADGAASLLLTTSKPGRVIAVTAPGSGEELQIVPVRPAGQGITQEIAWPEFKLLPTHQGIAVAARPDAVTIESLDQGVVVTTRPQGALDLMSEAPAPTEAPAEAPQEAKAPEAAKQPELHPEAPGEAHATPEPAPGTSSDGSNGLTSVPGLFDLPSWRRGGEATFFEDQDQLENAVTRASKEEKPRARLDVAEFYFAHGLLDEAESALNPIASTDSTKVDPREVKLLKAALLALAGETEEAQAILADRDLVELPETNLFLGLMAADAQDWPAAAKYFGGRLPNIGDYPKPIRDRLYVAGGRALANGGNPIGAQRFADALRQDVPDPVAADWLTYLDGLIRLKMGQRDEGLAKWETLADSEVDQVKAVSQYSLVEERLGAGDMKPAEAITRLERLRFVDRGGDFEFKLLRKLGGLYILERQPRKGLITLRQLAANFPDRPETKEVAEEMSRAFRELYMENGADSLSPLVAVALYDEFRELTPAGADGDRMITMLADRLVKVDLLDRAAALLEGQVKKRLTGIDKAAAGTRLAAIYMLDQKPDSALQALKDSEIDEPLPPELLGERRRLEARATFDAGDPLKGIQMLATDGSLEAKWLRADMLWRTREWPSAASALGDLIDGEERAQAAEAAAEAAAHDVTKDPAAAIDSAAAEEALKAKQEQHFKDRIAPMILNRAVALSLASDRRGLRGLARDYADRMAGTPQEKAFTMLTAADNGLVESVSAELAGVAQIDAFVTDYREKLKAQSLSAPDPAAQPGTGG